MELWPSGLTRSEVEWPPPPPILTAGNLRPRRCGQQSHRERFLFGLGRSPERSGLLPPLQSSAPRPFWPAARRRPRGPACCAGVGSSEDLDLMGRGDEGRAEPGIVLGDGPPVLGPGSGPQDFLFVIPSRWGWGQEGALPGTVGASAVEGPLGTQPWRSCGGAAEGGPGLQLPAATGGLAFLSPSSLPAPGHRVLL